MKNIITNHHSIYGSSGQRFLFILLLIILSGVSRSSAGGTVSPNCQITGNTSYCPGNTTELCVPAGASSYTWSLDATTLPVTSECITVGDPGTYSVFITNQAGPSQSCFVIVNEYPLPNCDITGNIPFCPSGFTTLCAPSSNVGSPPNLNQYLWSPNNETTACITATTEDVYSVIVTDNNGCSSECSVSTSFLPAPDVFAGDDFAVECGTTQVQLNGSTNNTDGGVDYSWTPDGIGSIISNGNTLTPTVSVPGIYMVTATDQESGCTATSEVGVSTLGSSCTRCNENTINITSNITINFNNNPPTYTGDPGLLPYVIYDKTGASPYLWKAMFNVGANKLVIHNHVTIKTTTVNGYAPGLVFSGDCSFELQKGGLIKVVGDNKNAGDIVIQFRGDITVDGEVRDETTDVKGLPGDVTVVSQCGGIEVGKYGIVQSIGEDVGGSDVTLMTCGDDCNSEGSGDIVVNGLVKSYAEALTGNQNLNRPNVKVVSFNGEVDINANTVEPIYDEFVLHGVKYDLYGGLLSWVDQNAKPGKVEVQARHDVIVNGHGTDPTGSVRRSFGAVAAVGTSGANTLGGLVDVRSIEGRIVGNDRSFDVSGKNRLFSNVARINLYAAGDVMLSRLGSNNNFNPILDARSPVSGGRGGKNDIRSYAGNIVIGTGARVLASVPSGSGTVQGVDLLESCLGVTNNGTVTPADLIPGNNTGSCALTNPTPLYTECYAFQQIVIDGAKVRATTPVVMNDVNVYPNPTDGKITLQFNSSSNGKYTVHVFSITGAIVATDVIEATEGVNAHEIDLSNLSKGMYILTLEGDNMKQQKRITVQ